MYKTFRCATPRGQDWVAKRHQNTTPNQPQNKTTQHATTQDNTTYFCYSVPIFLLLEVPQGSRTGLTTIQFQVSQLYILSHGRVIINMHVWNNVKKFANVRNELISVCWLDPFRQPLYDQNTLAKAPHFLATKKHDFRSNKNNRSISSKMQTLPNSNYEL